MHGTFSMMDLYKNIKAIKNKFPKSKIIAVNIYHPPSSYYKMYYNSIDLWNKLLKQNTFEGYNVLNIDEIIKSNNDIKLIYILLNDLIGLIIIFIRKGHSAGIKGSFQIINGVC